MSDKLIAEWQEADRQLHEAYRQWDEAGRKWGEAGCRLSAAGYRYGDGVWTKAEEATDEPR